MTSRSHMENVIVKKNTQKLQKRRVIVACVRTLEVFLNLGVYINEI